MQVGTSKRSVAVIGGGVAGLSFARQLLTSNKFDSVTVFDTGRLRPGGRASSRWPGDPLDTDNRSSVNPHPLLSQCVVDHAAQVLSIPCKEQGQYAAFQAQVKQWESQGVLQKFPHGSLYQIRASMTPSSGGAQNGNRNSKGKQGNAKGNNENKSNANNHAKREQSVKVRPPKITVMNSSDQTDVDYYFGSKTQGMAAIPLALLKDCQQYSRQFTMKQDVWVSPSSGAKYLSATGEWQLQASGQRLGRYDALVLAHNGKCADRLMSRTPAKQIHSLMQVNFAPTVPAHGGKRMTLNSIYSLTLALPRGSSLAQALPESFCAGPITNHGDLKWLTCQSRKYPHADHDFEVWTILSSPQFAKRFKGPQEFLPPDLVEKVNARLLSSLQNALQIKANKTIKPIESRLQLWGAAVPLNTWQGVDADKPGFLYDSEYQTGVCGDWLVEPSLAGAFTSGQRLADHLNSLSQESIGLEGQFVKSASAAQAGIASLSSS